MPAKEGCVGRLRTCRPLKHGIQRLALLYDGEQEGEEDIDGAILQDLDQAGHIHPLLHGDNLFDGGKVGAEGVPVLGDVSNQRTPGQPAALAVQLEGRSRVFHNVRLHDLLQRKKFAAPDGRPGEVLSHQMKEVGQGVGHVGIEGLLQAQQQGMTDALDLKTKQQKILYSSFLLNLPTICLKINKKYLQYGTGKYVCDHYRTFYRGYGKLASFNTIKRDFPRVEEGLTRIIKNILM